MPGSWGDRVPVEVEGRPEKPILSFSAKLSLVSAPSHNIAVKM